MAHTDLRWTRKHLLTLEALSADEIAFRSRHRRVVQGSLDPQREKGPGAARAGRRQRILRRQHPHAHQLRLGRPALSADLIDFSEKGSSVSKGETLIDTARNIEAMGVDIIVIRHPAAGAADLLAAHRQVQRRQRRRRRPRTSDAGPARSVHDPRALREDRRVEGGDRRRHRQQPRGAIESLGADQARRRSDPRRPADAAAQVVRATRRQGAFTTSTK